MTRNKVYGMLSIAAKAGRVKSGELAAEEQIRAGKAKLVIIAEDASGNTKDRFASMCRGRRTEAYGYGTKEELGRSIGKAERSVLAVTDEGLAGAILKNLKEAEAKAYGNGK
ncbi:MAG: ribosomal L7Ae/L30e/S12e/Gadd45 family protein [Lachnospiraceae bacterium]|nr:ribosomal L7Ae/L30e/S12e/Gadd45 family protein [Lachnospiraceae bacterium]